ncbi:hypothetical protein [Actinomadura madurae]|nr:hypothetical protein [Actinomadura madurae]MCP9952122.1 hypothetical protein [Actinomadura madurae]MCP9968880.1 hypothetical protein [Actinomadura madurae]MCP9981361.1 hypothetical protein [Actinomadura madurae]MCQ0007135.1 hypothetical protein [Actinomadura madurae]MCQ0017558.1 hypothetical protein [Actinomadura madurae]
MRLTLLYGSLFAASGAVLLAITFVLMRRNAVFKVRVPCVDARIEDCAARLGLPPRRPIRWPCGGSSSRTR